MKTITLKYAGNCYECGARLPIGSRARYYGRNRMYGTECHSGPIDGRRKPRHFENEGHERSFYDPVGAYASDGTYLGKTGPRCEDAPCCGCCP